MDAREQAFRLWQMLDDIDTLDDACRDNDSAFRTRVRGIQRKRFEVASGTEFDVMWKEFVGRNAEVDAGKVAPGSTLYEVTYSHGHKTLKAGDLVRMVEDPRCNNLLLRTDWTLHTLANEYGQYVHLRLPPMGASA